MSTEVEMENMQDLTVKKIRKRASTQAMQDNAEPNKRTNRSQDRGDERPEGLDLLSQIRVNQAQKSKEGWVERKVRQRRRMYCCGCDESVRGGGKCPGCGHERERCPDEDPVQKEHQGFDVDVLPLAADESNPQTLESWISTSFPCTILTAVHFPEKGVKCTLAFLYVPERLLEALVLLMDILTQLVKFVPYCCIPKTGHQLSS
ncbi:predicted protein [Histoplasma mississippiense (nom. inval.)]|uniref:predicted protein n=1 Tax=Ajellomyces capsulatus (strain NAm1 / WU24) TaxID=2059318 RepID=UPI000157BF45|nr:predicted protein [Histoplasma mississippiense (nom. inval.)]EDN06490.1 predicted protein [Histoplasma mississippiense (nom. inval.)]